MKPMKDGRFRPEEGDELAVSDFLEMRGKGEFPYAKVMEGSYSRDRELSDEELSGTHSGAEIGRFEENELFSDCDDNGVPYVATEVVYRVEEKR